MSRHAAAGRIVVSLCVLLCRVVSCVSCLLLPFVYVLVLRLSVCSYCIMRCWLLPNVLPPLSLASGSTAAAGRAPSIAPSPPPPRVYARTSAYVSYFAKSRALSSAHGPLEYNQQRVGASAPARDVLRRPLRHSIAVHVIPSPRRFARLCSACPVCFARSRRSISSYATVAADSCAAPVCASSLETRRSPVPHPDSPDPINRRALRPMTSGRCDGRCREFSLIPSLCVV